MLLAIWIFVIGLLGGVLALLGDQLYEKWKRRQHRKRWLKAGEQWTDLLNRVDRIVQRSRRMGPPEQFVKRIRKELEESGVLHQGGVASWTPKETAEYRKRVDKKQHQADIEAAQQRKDYEIYLQKRAAVLAEEERYLKENTAKVE
jgi:hypothetical protein